MLLSGCSSKKVYEPQNVEKSWQNFAKLEANIIDVTSDSAVLKNKKVLSQEGLLDLRIEDGYRLLGVSDGWVLSAKIDGDLKLDFVADSSLTQHFQLKKTIATASVKDDTLAVLFADNEIALYKLSTQELLFKEQGNPSLVVDSRIMSPRFMNDLVLFLTLDGKVIIVNSTLKKRLRTVIVSSKEHFNNIIYFNIVDNKLIAATSYTLLSMAEKEIREDYEIRSVAFDGKESLYIATKQGEILSLTPDLQLKAKLKFPFAHFLGLIYKNDKIYALEKEGYLIELEKDLLSYEVYEIESTEGYALSGEDQFYRDDLAISLD